MSSFEINPTFCFSLLGSFAIYVWTRPRLRALLAVVTIAMVLRILFLRALGGFGAYYGAGWISSGAFLGISSLGALAAARERSAFYAAAAVPLCNLVIGYTIPLTTWLSPRTFDGLLLKFDGTLGFQPSFVLGRLLVDRPEFWGPTTVIYYALPFAVGLVYGGHRLERREVKLLPLLLSMMVVGFLQYSLFPAAGPAYAFRGAYPFAPPQEIPLEAMAVPGAVRNCMPSLHFAAALLVWWNARFLPLAGRALSFAFMVATGFATLALGEHYVADLIVAVPFTLVFQAAWSSGGEVARELAIITGCGLTAAWLIALRWGSFVWRFSWLWIALTVAACAGAAMAVRGGNAVPVHNPKEEQTSCLAVQQTKR